ncbi:hypothetical protein [Aquimarina spongiae]|uniref:Prepilin-type N-terminal cleavage/methylation domain-containing protein n=1 Tax=Aquimarina spongiae TaxID=570521 RepID=A0A1M6EKW7_9FLAO|nr:hypothetical protein [Aquimarina spongiae]SHI86152.1 hypothetical protein SAMN04488508_103458 [Aquimarina spongiae]
MAILKKIRGATLIETLTASVLIIIVFMIASLSFNNIFNNHIKRDQSGINNRIKELHYLTIHQKIKLPYVEDYNDWEIQVINQKNTTIITYRKEGVEHLKRIHVE